MLEIQCKIVCCSEK